MMAAILNLLMRLDQEDGYLKQEGHDGPGSLTWVCEPRIFKLTDSGIKRAKVIIFTNYEGSPSSF